MKQGTGRHADQTKLLLEIEIENNDLIVDAMTEMEVIVNGTVEIAMVVVDARGHLLQGGDRYG